MVSGAQPTRRNGSNRAGISVPWSPITQASWQWRRVRPIHLHVFLSCWASGQVAANRFVLRPRSSLHIGVSLGHSLGEGSLLGLVCCSSFSRFSLPGHIPYRFPVRSLQVGEIFIYVCLCRSFVSNRKSFVLCCVSLLGTYLNAPRLHPRTVCFLKVCSNNSACCCLRFLTFTEWPGLRSFAMFIYLLYFVPSLLVERLHITSLIALGEKHN